MIRLILICIVLLAAIHIGQPANGQTVPPPSLWLPLIQTEPGVCPCESDSLNCNDFGTQPQAQACFEYCMACVGIDIHRLDQNNDGVACESLPPGWAFWETQP